MSKLNELIRKMNYKQLENFREACPEMSTISEAGQIEVAEAILRGAKIENFNERLHGRSFAEAYFCG